MCQFFFCFFFLNNTNIEPTMFTRSTEPCVHVRMDDLTVTAVLEEETGKLLLLIFLINSSVC